MFYLSVTFYYPMNQTYEIAISYASEDREYVSSVAAGLKEAGIRVYFDQFARVDDWAKDLGERLLEIYFNEAKFCLMFISKHYVNKVFPTFERQNAIARQIVQRGTYILPVRFDDSIVPGLNPSIIYLDARSIDSISLVQIIGQKLRPYVNIQLLELLGTINPQMVKCLEAGKLEILTTLGPRSFAELSRFAQMPNPSFEIETFGAVVSGDGEVGDRNSGTALNDITEPGMRYGYRLRFQPDILISKSPD